MEELPAARKTPAASFTWGSAGPAEHAGCQQRWLARYRQPTMPEGSTGWANTTPLTESLNLRHICYDISFDLAGPPYVAARAGLGTRQLPQLPSTYYIRRIPYEYGTAALGIQESREWGSRRVAGAMRFPFLRRPAAAVRWAVEGVPRQPSSSCVSPSLWTLPDLQQQYHKPTTLEKTIPGSQFAPQNQRRPLSTMSSQPAHPTLLIPGPIEFDDAVLQSMGHYRCVIDRSSTVGTS